MRDDYSFETSCAASAPLRMTTVKGGQKIPLANGAIGLADYRRNRTPSSRSLRLREKSYPSNDEEQYFPSTRNAPESNGERWSGPVMRGEKRGKNRPVRTIARAGIRACILRQTVMDQ